MTGTFITKRFFSSSTQKCLESVKQLGVLGAGQMGLGIAFVAANKAKIPVTIVDNSQESLDKSISFMNKLLAKEVNKNRITSEEADKVRKLVTPSTDLRSLETANFIIEAVPEIPKLKYEIFEKLAKILNDNVILATNTSSISITQIAASAERGKAGAGSRVVSTHFMNPVPVQKGVEIIVALQTSEKTLEKAIDLTNSMGKISSVSKDVPGFIANRVLMPYINEAIICLETGIGNKEDIDSIMKNGCAMPMGPLALADFIGLDTVLAILNVLHTNLGDPKYKPSVLLQNYVAAGWLGKKTGKGFYDYNS